MEKVKLYNKSIFLGYIYYYECCNKYEFKRNEKVLYEYPVEFSDNIFTLEIKESITSNDVKIFIENRLLRKTNLGLNQYLKQLEVNEYNIWNLFKKTSGKNPKDSFWIKIV
ncbi:MAG: hypothetical protein ACRDC3_00850 [Paraclostridium dentum]|uniref:hypothetical protein n=1 Tax=Paraclostridium dentum TaxID=2662455 RepID=UPI003EE4D6B6